VFDVMLTIRPTGEPIDELIVVSMPIFRKSRKIA